VLLSEKTLSAAFSPANAGNDRLRPNAAALAPCATWEELWNVLDLIECEGELEAGDEAVGITLGGCENTWIVKGQVLAVLLAKFTWSSCDDQRLGKSLEGGRRPVQGSTA
jgi:hypothetical protein